MYKIQVGGRQPQVKPKNETGLIHAIAGTSAESFITEGQRKRLWAIAKNELKLTEDQIKGALRHFGFERTESITRDQYEPLIEYLQQSVKVPKEYRKKQQMGLQTQLNCQECLTLRDLCLV